MQDQPFITRPMSVVLDALRFGCAFMVVFCHAGGVNVASVWPFSFSARFPHNCVVVFFVLSGLVISASVANRQTDLKSYAIARAARIFSVAIPAVLLSSMVVLAAQYSSGVLSAGGVADLLVANAMGLTFLSQGPFGSGVPGNQPYWSLCYEVWYYALFGA
jgi:peptidoglycan/LPS O-acetylase OafA/YrhL